MIAYRALLAVPRDLVRFVSRLLAGERRVRGTRRRTQALTCEKQALFVLVWFRKREDLAVLGAGFAISRATAYRYAAEGRAVLAACAPQLSDALERVAADGWSHVIWTAPWWTPTGARRPPRVAPVTSIEAWQAGKAHRFGGAIHAVMRPDGLPLQVQVSAVEPGSTHDLTAAPARARRAVRGRRPRSAHPRRQRRPRRRPGHAHSSS